ncbi:hypothetical protein ACGC1H_002446 [Rhizoctonia solani]
MPSAPSDPLPPRPHHETEHVLLPFLKQQPPQTLNRLYSKPSACLAVFRLLRQLDRQLVLNLLWCDAGVPLQGLMGWAKPDAINAMQTSVSDLKSLSVLRVSASNPPSVMLTTAYRDSLRIALRGGGDHRSFGLPVPPRGPAQMSVEQLDKKALEHWETILHYMVDTNSSAQRPGGGALHLLVAGGWLEEGKGGGGHEITSTGFQFLLQSPRAQLWDILLQYLHMSDARRMDIAEVLSFLFMLSLMKLGQVGIVIRLSPNYLYSFVGVLV